MRSERRIRRRQSSDSGLELPDDLPPLLQRIYRQRPLASATELERGLERMLPLSALGGLEPAAELLHRTLERQAPILVVADFDADGATSCALLVRGLRAMGARRVGYLVPDRFRYGYGLTPEIVRVALEREPELLITVDNGISSIDGVAAARAAGVPVLVTDHHLPGAELPAADVIVNPNQPGDRFPSKHLAGVGVVFYLLAALRGRLRGQGWFARQGIAEPNLAERLDLVALGTVADVVPLDHNNRILVHQGLQRIRAGRCVAGIRSLAEVAGRPLPRMVASDLGFALGPRLNAAGRLEDMAVGIECLLTDDPAIAMDLARRLDGLNRQRREIEQTMQGQALEQVEGMLPDGELPYGLCLYRPDWHQGVIGILAARIRERWHRPVIACAPGEEEGSVKGSARSIPGLHIRDVLDAVAARHPGLLEKFGGHAMAAGMSLRLDRLEAFSRAFDEEVRRHVGPEALEGVIHSDGPLQDDELDLAIAQRLRDAGPWGQAFPEPVFDGRFRIASRRVVGGRHLKLVLETDPGRRPVDAIAFNQADPLPDEGALIHAAYRL
ncbi:MAG TPA: single-stranded-DNA-specific exonuclease RecJ, partial [Sedimenticola thiotaurini]|nr:single-stranded-DNA-specific exonuclease RecJ [Sedimenticola thiotaurini]